MTEAPILVVDDDPEFRRVVGALLHARGMRVHEATMGAEALAQAREERPALVLLEVALPDVSGFEVCRVLREVKGDEIPIIFVSGVRTDPSDRAAGILLGGDDYLVKPCDPGELLARIRRCLERAQTRARRRAGERGAEIEGLTAREREVLGLLEQGLTTEAIADRLVISPKTVSTHVQNILGKLNVRSRAAAVAVARRIEGGGPESD